MNGHINRRMMALVVVVGMTAATSAFARLGESFAECTRRYGRALSARPSGNEVLSRYRKGGFDVVIVFLRARAVEITYTRRAGGPLDDRELQMFLSVNAASSTWVKVDQLAEWKKANQTLETDERRQQELMRDLAAFYLWTRTDGQAEASYDRENGELFICDAARLRDEQDPEVPEDSENPLGF